MYCCCHFFLDCAHYYLGFRLCLPGVVWLGRLLFAFMPVCSCLCFVSYLRLSVYQVRHSMYLCSVYVVIRLRSTRGWCGLSIPITSSLANLRYFHHSHFCSSRFFLDCACCHLGFRSCLPGLVWLGRLLFAFVPVCSCLCFVSYFVVCICAQFVSLSVWGLLEVGVVFIF